MPELAHDVVLGVRAKQSVGVGEDLGLEFELRNESSGSVTVIRPVCVNWKFEGALGFALEWTDASGRPILDPLGFGKPPPCGYGDEPTSADLLTVEPGGSATLSTGSTWPEHLVLPTARPGRAALRVRYFARGIEGASELQLLSEPVEIEITGGDLAMWSCRAEQVAAELDHEDTSVGFMDLLEASDGRRWLIASTLGERAVAGEEQWIAEIWLQPLGSDLVPSGDPVRILHTNRLWWWNTLRVATVGDRALVLTDPWDGGNGLDGYLIDLAGASASTPPRVSERRVVHLDSNHALLMALADRFVMLSGKDEVTLRVLGPSGVSLGQPRVLAKYAYDTALVSSGPDGQFAAVWLETDPKRRGMVQRFDAAGEPLAGPVEFEFDVAHEIIGARVRGEVLELAWNDITADHDKPHDMQGLYIRSFSIIDGQAREPAHALSREDRLTFHSGAVAWHGDQLLIADTVNKRLYVRVDQESWKPPETLSTTAFSAMVKDVKAGYVVLWLDEGNDRSRACKEIDHCVREVHATLIGPDGELLKGPTRLTSLARPEPFVPSADEWAKHCP